LVKEYFFTSITPLQRGFAAFCAENVLLLAYFLIRVGSRGDVEWIKAGGLQSLTSELILRTFGTRHSR
jgi:hypothetical protein